MSDGRARRLAARLHDGARSWLATQPLAVVDEEWRVISWRNPRNPGYAYPEAGGMWLSFALESDFPTDTMRQVARWLANVGSAAGLIGRNGIDYTFDTAIVARGLLRFAERTGDAELEARAIAYRDKARREFRNRRAAVGEGTLEDRWSVRFGAHLKKTDAILQQLGSGGRSAVFPDPFLESTPYTHAAAYYLEGCALAGEWDPVTRGAIKLARLQAANGGLCAEPGSTTTRSDATAQAVRLWTLSDRRQYAGELEGALSFLEQCQTVSGGIRYESESDDVNTWATIFTAQAARWITRGPVVEHLI
ncbi:MAG: hypothetical protein AAGF12_41225 [Myxococcota bacterium]